MSAISIGVNTRKAVVHVETLRCHHLAQAGLRADCFGADHSGPGADIVGIGYPVSSFNETSIPRWMDYTPSADPTADSLRAAQLGSRASGGELPPGGGPRFVGILRDGIFPFFRAGFRPTPGAGGVRGLFAGLCAVSTAGHFTRSAPRGPSLWWNKGDHFAREATYARTHPALNARLFLSVGADEERDRMVATVGRLATILGERHYTGLVMSTHVFEGENHVSVGPAAVSRSMRFLYPAPPRT